MIPNLHVIDRRLKRGGILHVVLGRLPGKHDQAVKFALGIIIERFLCFQGVLGLVIRYESDPAWPRCHGRYD